MTNKIYDPQNQNQNPFNGNFKWPKWFKKFLVVVWIILAICLAIVIFASVMDAIF